MRTEDDLDRLLSNFVRKNPEAARNFRRAASPIIRGLARRFGPDLPADLIEDVVSETYVLLLSRSGQRFDSRLGSARQFLFGVVPNAVKKVRANYRPPGFPSRYEEEDFSAADQVVEFDERLHTIRYISAAEQVENSIEVMRLLAGISSLLAAAIIAVYVHGERYADVSRRLGVTRFQIYRTVQSIRAGGSGSTASAQYTCPRFGSAA